MTASGGAGSDINLKADRITIDNGVTRTNLFDIDPDNSDFVRVSEQLSGDFSLRPSGSVYSLSGTSTAVPGLGLNLEVGDYEISGFIVLAYAGGTGSKTIRSGFSGSSSRNGSVVLTLSAAPFGTSAWYQTSGIGVLSTSGGVEDIDVTDTTGQALFKIEGIINVTADGTLNLTLAHIGAGSVNIVDPTYIRARRIF